ncbi:PREDICTED: rho guanine nucleotide exchange factor 26 [Cariama cristata]|uniref:rho guanine nucleotide exchange factor 26 n=1 Tax=Cariama cristata TaxID=54380 RepID=UPI000520B94D|nr:PREDICTED: rho guanine nucleotide exchange factor 26 [Cariama cristata]
MPSQGSRVSKTTEKVLPGAPLLSPAQGVTPPGPAPPQDQPAVLSTNSPAALKVGTHQIIPKSLASEIKVTSKGTGQNAETSKRVLKVRSMVESLSVPLVADAEEEAEGDSDSPGSLRRGLRSTSYRRAVVSGVDLDGSSNFKKKNRMSQPVLKAVVEDKEKFSSLGRIKKKMLKGQGTFDGEENAVLYQNYKEKALDIDSDEESEPREQKSDEKIVFHYKPLRSTWSQLSVVKKNGLSEAISQEERKRQEVLFKNVFGSCLTMTKTESHHLFSNITDVYEASKKFFNELEARHQNNIFIDDISDIVEKHTSSTFDPYVKYCTNEVYQQRTLQKLLATNPAFKEVLSRIESHEDCRNLPMISFLILPMQRVTRLPLLMDTICQKTPKDSSKYENCKQALKEVSKLVRLCNEGARKMERTEMMYTINSQLEFKIKPFPLVSSSRWLVKRGELTAYVEDTGLFSKRTSKQQVYFFLFNDVLIITKKKSEESYNVTDYSLRDQLVVQQCDGEELTSSPVKNASAMLYSRQSSAAHLFRLTVLSNHAGEKVEMLLGTETQSERARWITALGRDRDGQKTDRTMLTQVEIIRTYTAKQADELSLQVADVVLVYQKVNDGWYEGERLRDGERGWFPMECAKEITCRATIDKNMERMGRLLGLETNV